MIWNFIDLHAEWARLIFSLATSDPTGKMPGPLLGLTTEVRLIRF